MVRLKITTPGFRSPPRPENRSIFDDMRVTVYVPEELNPALSGPEEYKQLLFRLGSGEMPASEQIIPLQALASVSNSSFER